MGKVPQNDCLTIIFAVGLFSGEQYGKYGPFQQQPDFEWPTYQRTLKVLFCILSWFPGLN